MEYLQQFLEPYPLLGLAICFITLWLLCDLEIIERILNFFSSPEKTEQ